MGWLPQSASTPLEAHNTHQVGFKDCLHFINRRHHLASGGNLAYVLMGKCFAGHDLLARASDAYLLVHQGLF